MTAESQTLTLAPEMLLFFSCWFSIKEKQVWLYADQWLFKHLLSCDVIFYPQTICEFVKIMTVSTTTDDNNNIIIIIIIIITLRRMLYDESSLLLLLST